MAKLDFVFIFFLEGRSVRGDLIGPSRPRSAVPNFSKQARSSREERKKRSIWRSWCELSGCVFFSLSLVGPIDSALRIFHFTGHLHPCSSPRSFNLRINVHHTSFTMIYAPIAKTQLEWYASLNPLESGVDNKFFRKTSIIATIGPKTNNVEMLGALRQAGMKHCPSQCFPRLPRVLQVGRR